jgi:hypothetical protein
MASIGMLPRSLRSRGSVKDVWRHFVKDVMRLNTTQGLSGPPAVRVKSQDWALEIKRSPVESFAAVESPVIRKVRE